MHQRTIGLLMAATTALSWAVLAIALKATLQWFSAGTIVWFRMTGASLILLAIFYTARREWLGILRYPPRLGLLSGALLAGNYFGYLKGVEYTSASHAQVLIQLAPLSFAALSIFIYREVPSRVQFLGMTLAVIGFGLFYWDQILVSVDHLETFQKGNLWLLFAVATWAAFALIQKSLVKKFAPQQLNLLVYAVSAVLLAPTAQASELGSATLWTGILMLLLAANTVIAYGALGEALARVPSSYVSMIIASNPLVTIALMTILAQMEVQWIHPEPIHWRGFLGALLVVSGVILTVSQRQRLSSAPSKPTL